MQAPSRPALPKRGLVGNSPSTQEVRRQIREAVEAACETILITGETGTGKEVVAREIHFQAATPEDPFIAVSCPAMPDSLVESELFGHVKGAFTGATEDRVGYFEMADGSTILLDEAGDLSLAAQAKILRVLETRTLRRVGGSEEIAVQVRVIAATNAPLEDYVATGQFRRDLFYRLNAYTIRLAPLRERREDILPLAEHFLAAYAGPRNLPLDGFSTRCHRQALGVRLPRQRPRTPLPGGAGRHLVPVRPDPCRTRPAAGRRALLPALLRPPTSSVAPRSSPPWKKSAGTAATPPNAGHSLLDAPLPDAEVGHHEVAVLPIFIKPR